MDNEVLVSVIVPVYNIESYIGKCVSSIIAQTYKNIEIILVDDGSTDDSGDICDYWNREDSRIKVIHKTNGGLSDARNVGLIDSKGQYILFVDGDDYIEKNMINCMIEQGISTSSDMVVCNVNFVKEINNESSIQKCPKIYNGTFSINEYIAERFQNLQLAYVTSWGIIFKRDLCSQLSFRRGKINEDEFFYNDLIQKANTVTCINEYFYNYVIRQGSIMNQPYSVKRLDRVEAISERLEIYYQNGYMEYFTSTYNELMVGLIGGYNELNLRDSHNKEKIRFLKKEYNRFFMKSFEVKMPIIRKLEFLLFFFSPKITARMYGEYKKKYKVII